MILLLL